MKLALLSLFLTSVFLFAKDDDQGLSIALVSENETLAAGQPFTVGVRIQHDPEFHTYWKNPGIVGIPTMLDWELPKGFTASEISWPYPERCDMAGHPCHGYERDVLLLVTITPPKEQQAGGEVTLKAGGTWMCCARICYPGGKDFTLTIPVRKEAKPNPKLAPLFAQAREEVPKISSTWRLTHASLSEDKKFTLSFEGPPGEEPSYYFSSDSLFSSDKKQTFQAEGEGRWLLTIAPSEMVAQKDVENYKTITGVLQTTSGYHGLRFAAQTTATN